MPFVQRPYTTLYYESHGEGPAVTFLHGAGGNHISWWQQVPVFSQRYRCITIDHRGFGRSTDPDKLGSTRYVEDLEALLDRTRLEAIKELARLYVSRSVTCEFCGNQRSIKAADAGKVDEAKVDDLMNFEKSSKYSEREKAALAYAEAITWRLDTDDKFWERMRKHFDEPELVELGCFIALTMGQQSWLRLLDIDHHQVMAGTTASMAPGFETAEALAKAKAAPGYWAKKDRAGKKSAA